MTRRSGCWFDGVSMNNVIHRSWLKGQGAPSEMFDGRPVVGICNSGSDLTPCNAHFKDLVEHVKRGVIAAGGFPLEFFVTPLGESLVRPSTLMYRNLVSVEVEETIRSNPLDAVVLMTGCDKTTPALVMGAASCDLPTIVLPGGPMLNGRFRGREVGNGTTLFEFRDKVRAGEMTPAEFVESEACMARSHGHCNIMGTASTMAILMEALGLTLPGHADIPAVDARRQVAAFEAGSRIVSMVKEDLRLSRIVSRDALLDAIRVTAAIGGSSNAVIHLLAIAGRVGVPLTLDDWDVEGRGVPCLVDLVPAGKHLMEEFFYAGGTQALLRELLPRLRPDRLTVNGRSLAENVADAPCYDRDVIRTEDRPVLRDAGMAVLHGNLCPEGALIKPVAASPELMQHIGPAHVFDSIEELHETMDELDLTPDHVLVLRHCGSRGYPGMPEVGNIPLPRKLLEKGVKDMVRISDARMSGSAYGTVVLHVSPEAALGGALALVRTGDPIELDVPRRRLELRVDEAELARRRTEWKPQPLPSRGYVRHYLEHVTSPSTGADLDYLVGCSGAEVARDSH